jgi:4-hydroxy-3-methylbut-2-enyl diphosphate reductase
VLVVGSPNSSNSNRLKEIALKLGKPAYLIDGPDDIRPEWLKGVDTIGLTAGASAPEVLVGQVIERLRAWGAQSIEENVGKPEQVTFGLPKNLIEALGNSRR